MRRKVAALLTAALAIAMLAAGCGDDDDDGDSGSGGDSKLALIMGIKGDDFYTTMDCGAQEAADAAGAEIDIQAPDEFDPAAQTQIVNAVSATQPDALLIAPTDAKAMFAPINQVASGGAEIVLVDTVLEDTSIAQSSVRSDYEELGRIAGETLLELIGSAGPVLDIGVAPGISTLDAGQQGFAEVAEAAPGVEYLGTEYANNDQAKVSSIVSATLAREPDLAGIFTPSGLDQAGVVNALRGAGKLGDVKIVSADAQPVQVDQLRAGEIDALVSQSPFEMGKQGVEQALNALNGDPVEEEILTPLEVITAENVDDPEIEPFLYKGSC